MNLWEQAYQQAQCLWGLKPDYLLREYVHLVPEGPVLDLGSGEGRNALFLAGLGYAVEGFDWSVTAITRCRERARKAGLTVDAQVKDLRELAILPEKYALILAISVINFFTLAEAARLLEQMAKGLAQGGLVYLSAFSPEDPAYRHCKNHYKELEPNTFYLPRRNTNFHFFPQEELLASFTNLKTIYYSAGTGLDLAHGKPHYHGYIAYIGQRWAAAAGS